jgi:very-short-patch-repair endonuclease
MAIPYKNNLREISKTLRSQPTEAERCLWTRLKLKHLGYVFHRQKPLGGYIADFYCSKAKLVVEVDGGYHSNTEITGNDKVRDEIMRNLGLTVLRFSNSEALNNTDRVVETINKILLDSKSPLSPPLTRGDNPSGHKK